MKNILVIENNEDSLALVKEILEEAEWNVLGTAIIENGFDILKRKIVIELIFVSTVLEGTEGFDVLRRMMEELASFSIKVPVVAITSSAETNEGARALQEGCIAVVSKPIEEEEVHRVIKEALRGKDS